MKRDPEPVRAWTWPHYWLASHLIFPAIFRLAGGWRVTGREFIPRTGGALIAANHISYLDPPAVGTGVRIRRTYYFAKKELFANPVFGRVIRSCYAFPVDREGDDKEAFRHAIALLRAGELLTVYPEGGRSPDGTLQRLGRGAALIAARTGAPIVPCALYGTDHVLPIHATRLHRGFIQISFAPPIETRAREGVTKLGLEEITERIEAEIRRMQAEQAQWRAERGR